MGMGADYLVSMFAVRELVENLAPFANRSPSDNALEMYDGVGSCLRISCIRSYGSLLGG